MVVLTRALSYYPAALLLLDSAAVTCTSVVQLQRKQRDETMDVCAQKDREKLRIAGNPITARRCFVPNDDHAPAQILLSHVSHHVGPAVPRSIVPCLCRCSSCRNEANAQLTVVSMTTNRKAILVKDGVSQTAKGLYMGETERPAAKQGEVLVKVSKQAANSSRT